ncbi:MAG TPA: nitrilase-related carbon-nitrogen hydrolase [Candidatus Gastranaerophilaceae bacterium]|nr:nitrilase-related carbon-nitrogen hydrolase [Candidatus Gastranaerophilaceae bacterium]HPT41936.1 nitrilase-related carbon-nitrogen hydrolase [Candidatus Gastranaerophilaceae bacterium]
MEKKLKIAAIQMSSKIGDIDFNIKKIDGLIKKNIKEEIDLLILPEVWTVGWMPAGFKNSAKDIEKSKAFLFLSKIAKKYNTNIIGGSFITKRDSKYYNSCPVINNKGELIATYDKMHLFSYYGCDEGAFVEKGNNPVMVEFCLNSKKIASVNDNCKSRQSTSRNDIVKIGLSICYDIRFPEIYRAYANAGADLLINMAAWPKSRAGHWETLTKARAVENQCFMVALTQSGKITEDEWNLGHSRIIDFNGEVISQIKKGEGVIFAQPDFEKMYQFRKKCTVLLDIQENYDVKLF